MRRRLMVCTLVAGAAVFAVASEAAAQQTLNFSLGYFTVRGADARTDGDAGDHGRAARPGGGAAGAPGHRAGHRAAVAAAVTVPGPLARRGLPGVA